MLLIKVFATKESCLYRHQDVGCLAGMGLACLVPHVHLSSFTCGYPWGLYPSLFFSQRERESLSPSLSLCRWRSIELWGVIKWTSHSLHRSARTYTRTRTYTHTDTHTHTDTQTRTHVHTEAHTCTHTHTDTHTRVRLGSRHGSSSTKHLIG